MIRFQTATQQPIAFTSIDKNVRKLRQETAKLAQEELKAREEANKMYHTALEKLAAKIKTYKLTEEEELELIWAVPEASTILPVHWFTKKPIVKFLKQNFSLIERMQLHRIDRREMLKALGHTTV